MDGSIERLRQRSLSLFFFRHKQIERKKIENQTDVFVGGAGATHHGDMGRYQRTAAAPPTKVPAKRSIVLFKNRGKRSFPTARSPET